MSDTSQGPGWWLASDGKWYPPELWTGPPALRPPGAAVQPVPTYPTYPQQGPAGYPYGTSGQAISMPGSAQYPMQGAGAGYPYGQFAQPKTNGFAIASLVCSCAGLFFFPAVAGLIFGFVARSQITRANGLQKGSGLALAGIIVGFGWLALVVLLLAIGGGNSGDSGNSGIVGLGILLGQHGLASPFN